MLDIVIVNWNAGPQLYECVESVLAHDEGQVARIIVVDNDSRDGSADLLKGLSRVQVLHAGDNLGFAAACNVGAAKCFSPYLLFLNPDTRIEAGSLQRPLTFMERSENAGVAICGIQLVDEQNAVSRTCARFPTLRRLSASALGLNKLPGFRGVGMGMSNWDHESSRRVDQVMGAFFLIRRVVFNATGGFDERFFVYFEEVDLSRRATLAGWDSWYLADAQAFHAGGGTSRQVKARRLFYSLRSRLLYGFKHFPTWQAWVLVALTGLVEPLTRTAWCLIRKDMTGVRNTWAAYRMLWSGMGQIVHGEGRFKA